MKENLKRLFKGSAIYGMGTAVTQLSQMLLLPLFTSYLTPADYGISAMLLLAGFFATSIFSLGLGSSTGIVYFEKSGPEHREDTIRASFLLTLASAAAMLLPAVVFRARIGHLLLQTDGCGYLVALAALSAFFGMLVTPYRLKLQFEERQTAYVLLTFSGTMSGLLLAVLEVAWLKRGIAGYMEATLLGSALSFALFYRFGRTAVPAKHSRELMKELLRHGLPMVPSFLAIYVLQQGAVFVLKKYGSLADVGLYTTGFNLGSGIMLFVAAFTTAWPPFFLSFKEKQDEARILFGRVATYYVWGAGLLSFLFYLLAKPLVHVLTQPDFHRAATVVGLTATSQCLMGVFSLLLPGIYFSKEVKYSSLWQMLAVPVMLAAAFPLIKHLGIVGAALAFMSGYAAMCAGVAGWNQYKKDSYIRVVYEPKRLGVFLGLYVCAATVAVLNSGATLIFDAAVNSISFVALLTAVVFALSGGEKAFIKEKLSLLFSIRSDK